MFAEPLENIFRTNKREGQLVSQVTSSLATVERELGGIEDVFIHGAQSLVDSQDGTLS